MFCVSKKLYDWLYLIVCMSLASESLYVGRKNGIEAEVPDISQSQRRYTSKTGVSFLTNPDLMML